MPVNRPRQMLAMPALQTANPQAAFSGLANSPFPKIMFDDDLVTVGNPVNCNFKFVPVPPRGNTPYTISGVTRDSAGNALGGCAVDLYTTTDDVKRYGTVSDASGNYSFTVPSNGWSFYLVAYLAGSPDVAGTSVNTLKGA